MLSLIAPAALHVLPLWPTASHDTQQRGRRETADRQRVAAGEQQGGSSRQTAATPGGRNPPSAASTSPTRQAAVPENALHYVLLGQDGARVTAAQTGQAGRRAMAMAALDHSAQRRRAGSAAAGRRRARRPVLFHPSASLSPPPPPPPPLPGVAHQTPPLSPVPLPTPFLPLTTTVTVRGPIEGQAT